jgi:chitinase
VPAGKKYVSFTSYPGWIQASIPPGRFDYAPWTVISDFGLWPTSAGGIAVGDMQSLANIPPVVADGHKAGKTVIMAVGEQGLGNAFAGGARPQNRTKLINNIVSFVAKYDFDGVDIDWEEAVPQNRADYIALIKELRSALDNAFKAKHMFLSTDVNTGQIPPDIAAQVAPYVDTVNMETFQDNGLSSVAAYRQAGIPASKLLLGIGVSGGYYDSTEARVAAKVKYVEDHGLKGTLLWQPGALNTYRTDPRLIPLLQMVSVTAG